MINAAASYPELTIDDIDITEALNRRPAAPADPVSEIAAMHTLAREIVASPATVITRFAELGLHLCRAESAGISLFEAEEGGRGSFRWHGVQGRFAPFEGGTAPRDLSPCGVVLDRLRPMLIASPERLYPNLAGNGLPPIREALLVPLLGRDETPIGTIWIVSHSPERRFTRTEADLMTRLAAFTSLGLMATGALAEKDELLRHKDLLAQETDHRVANSLQLTASILRLHAMHEENPGTREALNTAAQRIGAIRQVHSRLYRTGPTGKVQLAHYMRDLCAELARSLPQDGAGSCDATVECDEISLPSDAATKLGLVVNELVTNAAKHHDGETGPCLISISIRRRDDRMQIVIGDNGPGLPPGFAIGRGRGLGMRLVNLVVQEFNGTIEAGNNGERGARFAIDIPIPTGRSGVAQATAQSSANSGS